jgi:hypothetical protein
MDEETIHIHEDALRAWFVQDADPLQSQIDDLDIGWGGTQRWATRYFPPEPPVGIAVPSGVLAGAPLDSWRGFRLRSVTMPRISAASWTRL